MLDIHEWLGGGLGGTHEGANVPFWQGSHAVIPPSPYSFSQGVAAWLAWWGWGAWEPSHEGLVWVLALTWCAHTMLVLWEGWLGVFDNHTKS